MRDVYFRLVPLKNGGIAANKDWGGSRYAELKEKFYRSDSATKARTDSWHWSKDKHLRIDVSHSALQITQQLIAKVDELKHLSSLTADQLYDLLTLNDTRMSPHNLLDGTDGDRTKPIDIECSEYQYVDGVGNVLCPPLLFLKYPLTIETLAETRASRRHQAVTMARCRWRCQWKSGR